MERIIKFIIQRIEDGDIDEYFNEQNFDAQFGFYQLSNVKISVYMLNDIKANPEHYKAICQQLPTNVESDKANG